MDVPREVVVRDCLAVSAIVLAFAMAARVEAQVLNTYTTCAVLNAPACSPARARGCRIPADADAEVAFLQWAVASHWSAAREAGLASALTPTGSAAAMRVGADRQQASARRVACNP